MSKKLLIAVIIAILAFGATVMATESRVETLGGQGLYLADDTGIFSNPALASYYAGMLRLHMGGAGNGYYADQYAYGGGIFALSDSLSLGAFVARNPSYEQGSIGLILGDAIEPGTSRGIDGPVFANHFTDHWVDPQIALLPTNLAVQWVNPFDLMLAYKMGDLSIGISYYLANGKFAWEDNVAGGDADDTATYDGKSRLHSIKLGVAYKGGNIEPQAWFHYDPYTITSTFEFDDNANGGDISEEQTLKGSKFVVGGRLFYNLNDNLAIVPAINWEHVSGDLSTDVDYNGHDLNLTGNTTEDDLSQTYKGNSVVGGVSVQYKADKLFLVTSASLKWSNAVSTLAIDTDGYDSWEYTLTNKQFAAPEVAMGLEYQAAKWACLRGGIRTTTIWATNTDVVEQTFDHNDDGELDSSLLQTVQSTTAAIGTGLMFGNLTIDATFGNLFLTGEDGSSSIGQGPNLFSHLDAKYMFK